MESYIFKPFILIVSLILSSSIKCLVDTENKLDYLFKRSSCASCKRQLKPFDLIPIFSFLFNEDAAIIAVLEFHLIYFYTNFLQLV